MYIPIPATSQTIYIPIPTKTRYRTINIQYPKQPGILYKIIDIPKPETTRYKT